MTNSSKFNPAHPLSSNDSLLISLFVAALVHVVFILGINFSSPIPEQFTRSIDVTLVNTPAPKAPEKAKFLAPENQIGAGDNNHTPKPPTQKLPSHRTNPSAPPQQEHVLKTLQRVTTQAKSPQKTHTTKKANPETDKKEKPHLNPELLQQQLAQLGSEIRQHEISSEKSNITFVSEISAHKYVAAQYLKDWENKVERVGNLNYPEVAAKKNFSGTLIMDVTINADGSLHDMIIKRSSGTPALDEAAKQIVRMSAPFPPLPLDLLKELNPKILGITRIWKFSDESMTAR
ncbi:MAG: TonB family protein [Methylovulum sp.]|jgi:protein TonB|nr:TonB family protein [Methylovulum sp.]MCF7997868.1 TonB family protein [Methylovulum sp.]